MENQGVPNPTADDLLREASIIGTNTNANGFKTKSVVDSPQGPAKPLGINDYNTRFSEIANIKMDPLRFSTPSQFGAGTEGFHLDRYYAHPDANILGINPANFNTEQYYNEKGSVGGDFVRMAKYLPSTAWGFTKDYLEPWTNPSSLFDASPDLDAAHNYHYNMGIMMSSKEGFAGSSVNFFANLAPTIGIAAGVAIERAALFAAETGAKFVGGDKLVARFGEGRSVENMMRIPQLIERSKSIKSSLSAFVKMESAAKLKAIWNTSKGLGKSFLKEVNPVKNIMNGFNEAEQLKGLAALSKTYGGFHRDLQRVRFTLSESQVEGGGAVLEKIDSGRQEYAANQQKEINRITKQMQGLITEDNEITDQNQYSQLYNELNIAKQKLASGPDAKESAKILTIAEQNGKAVTLINIPIIYATNAFGFEKLIGHSAAKRTLSQEFVRRYNKHLVRSTVMGAAGKASYQLLNNNIKKWGSKAYWKHAIGQAPSGVLDYLGKNVPEGVQELFQEGALVGVDHYYTTKFNDPLKFHKGVLGESVLVGANSQFSKQGLEVFLQGTLGGAAMWSGTTMAKSVASPLLELGKKTWYGKENYDKFATELDAEANKVLTAAQKAADDPEQFYALFDKAAGEQINFARVGQVAEALGDQKSERDIRNDATISYVHTLAQAGRLDVIATELKGMRELSAEDLANAMSEDYVEADQGKYFDRLEKAINKVGDLGERFKKARELMPNKYKPNSINKNLNPDQYRAEVMNYQAHEEGIFFSVYATKTFEETLDRMQAMQQKFAAIPSFSKIPGMNASKIFSVSQMQDDVNSLRTRAKIFEENGDKALASRLNKQANELENLANASAVFTTLSNLSGKNNLSPEETKELEQARKIYLENLAKTNEENETEYTLDDLTSQDALDEYEKELKNAFDSYFNGQTTSNNVRPFLNEELTDMFSLYKDWHSVSSDNKAMAKWVNMLTDPAGFNAFKNNIASSLNRVYNNRNAILREQKKKFMKGVIQNAFIQKLFDETKVYVDVADLESFTRNSKYPKLIDARTNQPLKANDPRIPMIEEMFDNYEKTYNKVIKDRTIREASAQLNALEELFSFAHKAKNKEDKRGLIEYARELGIDAYKGGTVSIDEVCDFIVNSKFATSAERKLAQKIKGLNTGMNITFKTNHSSPVTYDGKNGIIVDLRYASPKYDRGANRSEYLMLKGMMMSLTTDFLDDKAFADEVEEMMTAVVAAAQANPALVNGKIPFGLSSPQAFISEVMTNPEFQALLAQVKSTRDAKTSTFNDIIKAITKYLKNVFKINSTEDTVLKQATALVGLTIDQSDYLQKPGNRRAVSPAEEALSAEPADDVLEEAAIDNAEEETTTEVATKNLTPEEEQRRVKLLNAIIKATSDALKFGIQPLTVTVDGKVIGYDEANAEADALRNKASGIKAEDTNEEKVAKFRALEQDELRKAIPDIDSYRKPNGDVDKSKLTGMNLAIYNQIYNRYDKIISPLLGLTPASETTTAVATTEEIPEVLPIEETPEDIIKNRNRKDLFPDTIAFANDISFGNVLSLLPDSKISSYREVNGVGIAEYINPKTGLVDVIMTGTSDNDFVGYIRIYEKKLVNGSTTVVPTNRWTSKMENKSGNKDNFKTMLAEVQKSLPAEHEYTEKTNISLDGLRIFANNLKRGYEILTDDSGNIITSTVTLNAATLDALRSATTEDEVNDLYEPKTGLTREDFDKIKEQVSKLLPEAILRFNTSNGSVIINLPVLVKKASTKTTAAATPTATPAATAPVAEVKNAAEPTTEDEIDSINTNSLVEELPKDLYDLLYAEYKKTIKIAKIKESTSGFVSFKSTNSKASKIINKWKEDKKAGLMPAEEEEVDKPLNLAEVRQAVLDRGWLPEDINGFTEEYLINIYNSGISRDQAFQLPEQSAEFIAADLKVAKFIETLKKNLKDSGVTKVEGKGYIKNGNPLPRVSDIVKDILQKEFKNASAANRGNVLDPIFREFFDGKIISVEDVKQRLEALSEVKDPETGEKMMTYSATFPTDLLTTLRDVKQYLNDKGLKVIGGIPTLYGNIGGPRSGEIDFLVYRKDGSIGIVDLKTSTFNLKERYDDPADELQYKRSHTIQQLAYRELIRQATGEDIKSIYILPIELSFDGTSKVVKKANTINTGTDENPSMLLPISTSRDIFEVTGIGRPLGVAEPVRSEDEQQLLNDQEKAEQLRRIEALKAKLDNLKGQQIAALQARNVGRATDLIEKITKITDELKLYGVDVSLATLETPIVEEAVVEAVKPEVGMILKLADGKLVKIKKITKKQITVVPLNDEDAEGQVLDADTVEGIENMVVSTTSKKTAPAPKPETEEVMNESKSTAETLSGDKDAQAKLASEAEKMTESDAKNNFLKNLNNRCE